MMGLCNSFQLVSAQVRGQKKWNVSVIEVTYTELVNDIETLTTKI